MAGTFEIGERMPELVDRIVESYFSDDRTRHIDRGDFPSRAEVVQIIEMLLELSYPGYYGRQNLTRHNVRFHVGELLPRLSEKLHAQIKQALCYQAESSNGCKGHDRSNGTNSADRSTDTNGSTDGNGGHNSNRSSRHHSESLCESRSREATMAFLEKIPTIRELLAGDVQAAYDGDPAAVNTDEAILAYPGVLAVTVYRYAHELYLMGVPLIPRTMTEWAHQMTGVDIHPGATIGRSLFIDHGTGVVIGETSEIGDNAKFYQGVTLGALSFAKDERGRLIRGHKRHPTLKDHVTIYANATVLGGETVLGEHSMVGASVFLTSSIPDNAMVRLKDPELRVRKLMPNGPNNASDWSLDFQI